MNSKKHIRLTNASLATMAVAIGVMFSRFGLKNSFANGPNQSNCDLTIDERKNCTVPFMGGTYVDTFLGPLYKSCAETNDFNGSTLPICCQYDAQRKFCRWDSPITTPTRSTYDSGYIAKFSKQLLLGACDANTGVCSGGGSSS